MAHDRRKFSQTLLGIVDTFMVAALGAAIQIMYFGIAALSATSVGSSVLVAKRLAQKSEHRLVCLPSNQSLVWSIIISIPLILVGLFATKPIIAIFGMDPDVSDIGVEYLHVTMGTAVVLTLLVLGGGVLRGAGDSRTPMLVTAFANIINNYLDLWIDFWRIGHARTWCGR